MLKFTIDRFYQLLREATIFYPKNSGDCHIPKTFGVIQHISDMNSPNLSKSFDDYDKGFFYSERWRASGLNPNNVIWDYPLVAANYYSGLVSSFSAGSIPISNNITIGCYDIHRDHSHCNKPTICNQRLPHEIESDCEKTLVQILTYIDSVVLAELNGVEGYYSENYLAYKKLNGSTYRILARPKIYSSRGAPFYITHPDTGIEYTYGAEVRIDILTQYCPSNDLDFRDGETLNKIVCCG